MKPRIAICFSGQPRTWRKAIPRWQAILDDHRFQVDAFCHLWSFNTPSAKLGTVPSPLEVEQEEMVELISTLHPISHRIEGRRAFSPQNTDQALARPEYLSQFYGIMECARLKRSHEMQNGFVYDAVIRARYDLMIRENPLDCFEGLQSATLHGTGLHWELMGKACMISDLCWMADGLTYDRIADFYLDAGSIGKKWFDYDYKPEHVFFHHLKSNQLAVKDHRWEVRIIRNSAEDAANPEDIW